MTVSVNDSTLHLSSAEYDFSDPARFDDVEAKHRRAREILQAGPYDALLLQAPCNFAWFTSGARCPSPLGGEPGAALFVTPEARVVVTNNIDAPQLFEKQLGGLGFQLKQRFWNEPRLALVEDLCRGRTVASDSGDAGTRNESRQIAARRMTLEPIECERMRRLGSLVAHAVEATARHLLAGQPESEIAGQLANRLVRHEVDPVWLRVAGDGRLSGLRHWTFGDQPVRKWCVVGATGRRWGLNCSAARVVTLGTPPEEVVSAFQQTALLEATGAFFSRPGETLGDAWQKVRRIYEKQGVLEEWQLCDQADVTGYRPSEALLVPGSGFRLGARMAIYWHPSVRGIQSGDTILTSEAGSELVTRTADWPSVCVTVRNLPVHLPDILIREAVAP
jgi:Xaa-Pro aminopeptidase